MTQQASINALTPLFAASRKESYTHTLLDASLYEARSLLSVRGNFEQLS